MTAKKINKNVALNKINPNKDEAAINNGNDISQFTNEIKNIDTLELFGLNDVNLDNLLNENLK